MSAANRCKTCGDTALIDAVDNHGNTYRGCAKCKVAAVAVKPAVVVVRDAWIAGFGMALVSIWKLHHDGQMVGHIITANGFTLDTFRDHVDADDYAVLVDATLGRLAARSNRGGDGE